jgi:endonuclease/exonuclease/phosphatase family metal-dependent hydrolase
LRATRKEGAALPAACALAVSLSVAGCAERAQRAAGDEFTVMTYNLYRYCYDDRDRDGQRNDPKPDAEIAAIVETIAGARPDVLAVQEMGAPDLFQDFRDRLRKAGLDYPHAEYIPGSLTNLNIAVLSRFPFSSRQSATNETYTIGIMTYPVQRGFINVDVQVRENYRFRLLAAHLKSKVFHPAGQTEMRRNEARLLGKQVRHALEDNPELNLLAVGDFNDTQGSAPLAEIIGGKSKALLVDLRPSDASGDRWTHYWHKEDVYERLDYMLVSEGMLREVVPSKTRVLRPRQPAGSDHRPVQAVFKARDL